MVNPFPPATMSILNSHHGFARRHLLPGGSTLMQKQAGHRCKTIASAVVVIALIGCGGGSGGGSTPGDSSSHLESTAMISANMETLYEIQNRDIRADKEALIGKLRAQYGGSECINPLMTGVVSIVSNRTIIFLNDSLDYASAVKNRVPVSDQEIMNLFENYRSTALQRTLGSGCSSAMENAFTRELRPNMNLLYDQACSWVPLL